jgi:CO/xanthine dehydrogenase Mo-binding subunit
MPSTYLSLICCGARCCEVPIAYGRIERIDVTKALALPGVKAVVTGLDVAGVKIGRQIYDMPVLADGVVRFADEKVAAVAADSEEIAERALERIDIEYEELSPVPDPIEALLPVATLLHPQVMKYKGLPEKLPAPGNMLEVLIFGNISIWTGSSPW